MTFAKWVFTIGGVFGLLMISPLFFLEDQMAAMGGAPLSHPENYYGFVGVTFAWQLVYLLIGRDPARYRPVMLLGALGKMIFVVATWTLALQGRTPVGTAYVASSDLLLAVLFVVAWFRTGAAQGELATTDAAR